LKINLPDLNTYKSVFQSKGVPYPLSTVKIKKTGLLEELPQAENDKPFWPWGEEVDPTAYDNGIEWPKLTIVTPSYNQGRFIEQTIRSVLLQNYPNLEYIIIDGGSTDSSADIIKKYSPWLSYWKSQKDRGQGNAINQGFSLASGEYYAWINSDDHYIAGTFFKVIKKFIKTQSTFVYGYTLDFVADTYKFNNLTKILPFSDYFIRIPSLAQPSCFWNVGIHQPIWEDLYCSLDYELWLRMVKGNKRNLIKEPLSVATIHIDAKTSDPKMKKKWLFDHHLICSDDAHGSVSNWNSIIFINKIRGKLYQWLRLY
jgi:glycosyltransferase involved in cell wall biosynthesis